jgi:zinc and cadmium transporter
MTITLYCVAIALASLAGGYLPLATKLSHLRLQVYLSLSAGAMLGAAFFHMLPEAAELAGRRFGWWMALGVIGLFVVERFLSPHSHAPPDTGEAHHASVECRPDPVHELVSAQIATCEHRSAAQKVAGWSAIAGLSIHTLLGGVALGSAVIGPGAGLDVGLAVFLATLLHKPADSLTISTLLLKAGSPKRSAFFVQFVFASLIPLGVLLFYLGRSALAAHLDAAFTGCVLAFSAGTFVCIALSDLLPEVQFHSHDRLKLFLAVLIGAALMWATALAEPRPAPGLTCTQARQITFAC